MFVRVNTSHAHVSCTRRTLAHKRFAIPLPLMAIATMAAMPAAAVAARRVVVLAGPTAVGKSALAMRLCELLPGELISVDSVQVYRGLQIGANKPSADERARIVHHLLDVRDPDEEYTAGAFYADALRAVEEVLARGRVPVLVGGTSMYLRWLVSGRPEAPKADPAIADQVRVLLAPLEASGSWAEGLEQLAALDAARAKMLSRNDWYRLSRALTVALQTSNTAAALPRLPDPEGLDSLRSSLDLRCFFLAAPREALCRRIDARCEAMLEAGLLEEASSLLASGRLLPSSPAGRAIGYRQVLDYLLRSPWAPSEGAALVEFLEGFTAASRRYAAQQVKWFRNEPQFEWVEADWAAPETVEQHVLVQLDLERSRFEQVLQAPRQAELRGLRPDEAKRMKTYAPRLRALDDATAKAALLARADACRAQLEPHLEALRAADAELSRRYPWHKECKGGGAGADAEDAEAVAKRLKSGDRGTDGLIISP